MLQASPLCRSDVRSDALRSARPPLSSRLSWSSRFLLSASEFVTTLKRASASGCAFERERMIWVLYGIRPGQAVGRALFRRWFDPKIGYAMECTMIRMRVWNLSLVERLDMR